MPPPLSELNQLQKARKYCGVQTLNEASPEAIGITVVSFVPSPKLDPPILLFIDCIQKLSEIVEFVLFTVDINFCDCIIFTFHMCSQAKALNAPTLSPMYV